jgi:hypothetical protein
MPTTIYEEIFWLQKLFIHGPIYLLYNLQKESRRSVEKCRQLRTYCTNDPCTDIDLFGPLV